MNKDAKQNPKPVSLAMVAGPDTFSAGNRSFTLVKIPQQPPKAGQFPKNDFS
ncbi:MAG: hypothetical protein WBQ58_06410 [Methanoregula sp.]